MQSFSWRDAHGAVEISGLNNFDLLRFVFAAIVFFVHAFQLSKASELSFLAEFGSSHVAVQSFFVVSGFLIFMSYENSSSIGSYFEKRARRIYPAYFTVVLLTALLGVFITSYDVIEYFSSGELYRYLAVNLIFLNFLQHSLPGVFADNHMNAVNGALWTLKIEVMFYLSVPLIVWFLRRVGLWQGLLAAYIASFAYSFGMGIIAEERGGVFVELQRQLPGQLMYFIAGGALYYYYGWFKRYVKWVLAVAILLYIFEMMWQIGFAHAAALAVIVIYLALGLKYLGNFGKYGDFSYGVYILHCPILQTMIAYRMFETQPYMALFYAALLVLLTAAIMWHLVEKPMLKKSSHYVQVNQ